ncbi:MAG: glycosyltransferase [Planctomycetota bacterium]
MPEVSIIIPAHNEAAVIGRLLRGLFTDADAAPAGTLEVVVVANGCTDDTVVVAESFAEHGVRVIDTSMPGKANALNLGDDAATTLPRLFVDADVMLSGRDALKVAEALRVDEPRAAAPAIRFALDDRPWAVRAFYRTWSALPYVRSGLVGSGCYGVSAAGRAAFDRFPKLTADDAFVRLTFTPDQRCIVRDATFTVTPPTTLAGIVDIKTRSHFGNRELKHNDAERFDNEGESHRSALLKRAANPLHWPALAVYLHVMIAAKLRAKRRWQSGDHARWERDESSRTPVAT